jgi:hypothetical protein
MTRPPAASDTASLKTRAPRATAILPPESHTEATNPLPRNRHPAGASRFVARALKTRQTSQAESGKTLTHQKTSDIKNPVTVK